MAVDFQTKKREREKLGFALRNVKLRFSRKLLYLAGLITCFSFSIWREDENLREAWDRGLPERERAIRLISYLEGVANTPPLALACRAFLDLGLTGEASRKFLGSYDQFVGLLSDSENREHLENLSPEEMAHDDVYQRARAVSHSFQDAIEELFLKPGSSVLSDLTIRYGVF